MAFSSRPLLRAHQERLCVGTPMDSGSHGPRGDQGRARRLQDPSGEPSQQPAVPQGHPRAPELLEAHKHHVAEIQARTQQLEQQRAELCRRLAVLADEQLQLKPRRSPEALRGLSTLPGEAPRLLPRKAPRCPQLAHFHPRTALHLNALLPPAGPLAAEASGGHDAAILAQLLDLQVEATALEKRAAQRTECRRAGTQDLDAMLLAVELENQRLEDELLALKVRKARQADASLLAAQQHMEDLAQLQAEVGMLRRQAEGTGPRAIPPVFPPPQLPPARSLPGFHMEPPGPALGPSHPPAPSRPPAAPSLSTIPIAALEDPPPAREPPAEHGNPWRHIPSHF
ncbi:coiled-coil domain-containing protein 17 [Oxyura jamaicensis]|uniref:coiled-coil domain-containing protein 17 n=1 Tax=Oxyura jamaicensis TaxID=8884 RepID=UPI0015A64E0F|nr:coiled-coil domain-containing protein 17 [Oxyura jamaicensis]